MKPRLYLYAVCCLLYAVCPAQWLETTIEVGDNPVAFCYDSQDAKVYCANSGEDPGCDSTVTVIDGATNQVIATVAVEREPVELCYNLTGNKVYVANWYDGSVSVIDALRDTVVKTLDAGWCSDLCHNPLGNKLYCGAATAGMGGVYDCVADTFVAVVVVGIGDLVLCHNPQDNKVYCAGAGNGNVTVIDCVADTTVARIGIGREPHPRRSATTRPGTRCTSQTGEAAP